MEVTSVAPEATGIRNCDSSPPGSHRNRPAKSHGLRTVVDRIPKRVWVVAIVAFWERFTFWGVTAPWQNYMQNSPESDTVPGYLGLGQASATRIYNGFYIFYYITPLPFAVVSDTRFGRYKTLCLSVMLYILGCGLLLLSSSPSVLPAGRLGLPGLLGAMALIGLGGGGFKAIMPPFIVDQYLETQPKLRTLRTGEQVMTDRALTVQYIYNLYYWVGNLGSLSWFATTFLEFHNTFTSAYSIPLIGIILAMAMLLLGLKWYIKAPQNGNVLPKVASIFTHAARNGFKMSHARPEYLLEHREKIVSWTGKLCDELCDGLRACRVLVAFVMFYVCFDQMQTNLISQAGQMEFKNFPNDALPGINQVACIVLGPLIQHGLYPFLQRRRISFNPIARITVGFMFIALSMFYATFIQKIIYSTGPCYKHPKTCLESPASNKRPIPNHVNVWIQAPMYVLIAIGEIFAQVTALEYANENSPEDMKAIVQAINLLIAGVGSACAMSLTPIARDPYVIILYACLAGAMVLTTTIFWWIFHAYDNCYSSLGSEDALVETEENPGNNNIFRNHLDASTPEMRLEGRHVLDRPPSAHIRSQWCEFHGTTIDPMTRNVERGLDLHTRAKTRKHAKLSRRRLSRAVGKHSPDGRLTKESYYLDLGSLNSGAAVTKPRGSERIITSGAMLHGTMSLKGMTAKSPHTMRPSTRAQVSPEVEAQDFHHDCSPTTRQYHSSFAPFCVALSPSSVYGVPSVQQYPSQSHETLSPSSECTSFAIALETIKYGQGLEPPTPSDFACRELLQDKVGPSATFQTPRPLSTHAQTNQPHEDDNDNGSDGDDSTSPVSTASSICDSASIYSQNTRSTPYSSFLPSQSQCAFPRLQGIRPHDPTGISNNLGINSTRHPSDVFSVSTTMQEALRNIRDASSGQRSPDSDRVSAGK